MKKLLCFAFKLLDFFASSLLTAIILQKSETAGKILLLFHSLISNYILFT